MLKLRLLAILAAATGVGAVLAAEKLQLAPFKDELFKYPKVLATDYDGDYLTVEFNQRRDVVDRDDKPDEKTKAEYVSLDVKPFEADRTLNANGTRVDYVAVGKT